MVNLLVCSPRHWTGSESIPACAALDLGLALADLHVRSAVPYALGQMSGHCAVSVRPGPHCLLTGGSRATRVVEASMRGTKPDRAVAARNLHCQPLRPQGAFKASLSWRGVRLTRYEEVTE